MFDSLWPHGLVHQATPWNSPGKNTGVGSHSLSPGDLSDSGIELGSLVLQADSLPSEPPRKRSAQFSSVQLLSRVRLFVTPWIAARQASQSITNSQSLLKHTSIESVMPSKHLILCCPFLLLHPIPPRIRVFSNELFAWGDQSIEVSASASVLPMNTPDWSPT